MDQLSCFHENATVAERIFQVNEQVGLRVVSFESAHPTGNMPLVLVAGLSTIMDSFQGILRELTRDFTVHYIETREKPSSRLSGNVRFNLGEIGRDVAAAVQMLGLTEESYVLMGYSFGAAAIADGYRNLVSKPFCLLFVEPTPALHFPGWSLIMIRWFGVPFYPVVKAFVKWYLYNFRIDKAEDEELVSIISKALDNADPVKLSNCILENAGYKAWDVLKLIDSPSLVVATSKDKLHVFDDVNRMVTSINDCSYIDMEDNRRTHSAEMGYVIRDFLKKVKNEVK